MAGHADALALPRNAGEVAAVLAWCYEHDVPLTPRGGGTGFAGGAVPLDGGVVLDLRNLNQVRSLDPALWRAEVEAGVTTAVLRRRARENGLLFAPDPGAAEQSQIGGNIATNAGGPHTFKYGATGAWVTGLEVVLAPGEVVRLGGAVRKDVAGYDLQSLLIGSEGTLGIVTAAWLRLIPAPERCYPVLALYPDARAGMAAVRAILEAGIDAAAIEYLDNATMALAGEACPADVDATGAFAVLAEVDGDEEEALRARGELLEALGDARETYAPGVAKAEAEQVRALWRWRAGIPYAVQAPRGGKLSEDIVVPLDRLEEAIDGTLRDRCAPRPRRVQLGPRRRRQPALDDARRSSRPRGGRTRRKRRAGAVRARGKPRRLDLRRARTRHSQERVSRGAVDQKGARTTRCRQAPVRSQGSAEPRHEAGGVETSTSDRQESPAGGRVHPAQLICQWPQLEYRSDPGVVSSSPLSSRVFSPERIIGQPPYSSPWAFSPSWS